MTRLGPNPSYLQRLEGPSLGAPVALVKGAPAPYPYPYPPLPLILTLTRTQTLALGLALP